MFTYEVLDRLRKEYGKAFYVIDKDAFLFHFHLWREALSAEYPNVEIAYSYKTNYLPFLCDAVNRAGGFAEVVSATEFSIAQRINVPIDKIILNGPYKPLHLTLETLSGGGTVNVDSFSEAEQIVDYICTLKEKPAYIGIRCNFCVDNRSSRFGIATDSHDFIKTINLFAENGIKINSLHCHIKGRGVDTWKKKAQNIVAIYKSIKNYCSDNCIIGLGGGLPALIDEHERKIQIEAYVDAIAGTFKREFWGNGPHLFLEPGTALAAPCMSFVTSVMNKKELNGIMYAILMASTQNTSSGKGKYMQYVKILPDRHQHNIENKTVLCGYT